MPFRRTGTIGLMRLEASCAAKINLCLAVGGRRLDGYHELRSVVLRVGLSDHLGVTVPEPAMEQDRLAVAGDTVGASEDNLVLRAAQLLRAEHGGSLPGLALVLEKRIPIGAGLGGGSSDAAAALELAAEAWGLELTNDQRARLALQLGADVPFFAGGHEAALVGGVGEEVTPLPAPVGDLGVLLISPPIFLPTAAVYAARDALPPLTQGSNRDTHASDVVTALAAALRDGLSGSDLSSSSWSDRLVQSNDLWPAAIAVAPELTATRANIEDRLGRRVVLTGSGSTVFCLYPSLEQAVQAGRTLTAEPDSLAAGSRVWATDLKGPDPAWSNA